MQPKTAYRSRLLLAALSCVAVLSASDGSAPQASPADGRSVDPGKSRVIDHWTRERRTLAISRDLAIDPRGLAYLRRQDGTLQPYGHAVAAEMQNGQRSAAAVASPTVNSDTTGPSISNMDPGSSAVVGASHTFSATVTDASGVRSVSFVIQYPDGVTTQTFRASANANDTWSSVLQGFTSGNWSWWVEAKDGAPKGGNRSTSGIANFSVDTGSGTGGGGGGSTGGDTITNAQWTGGGAVHTAAGRLYFEMPNNAKRKGPWTGYVCSGTAVTDETSGRSIILTAAHCVYDDVNKAYARNVLFIPDQAGTTGSGTDVNCNNDPIGCWAPSFGVVDVNWTTRTFPDNIPWDYGFYAIQDSGAHAGTAASSDSLEAALTPFGGTLPVSFSTPYFNDGAPGVASIDFTHALGYSYSDDPKLMYCAEDMIAEGAANWWLSSCGLSGGSSGGPWIQPLDLSLGTGPIISLNSWGYTNSPGMAGPKLASTSAQCVFTIAKTEAWSAVSTAGGDAGVTARCP